MGERVRESDDIELGLALAKRDPRALATLYERDGSVVLSFLLGVLKDRPNAEDVLQQTFLEVWQRAPTFDPERGRLLAWVMTIARSRAIDQLRKKVPEPIGSLGDAEGADQVFEQVSQLSDRWLLVGMLRRIPRDEAEVIRLRFYSELSQSEIADRTGMPLGTVKTRMVSGLRRLRELMGER